MSKTYVEQICKAKGLKLVNATRPMILGVAVDDIVKARQKNSKCCAFARAAKREPGVRAAYFFRSTAFLEFDDRIERYWLPQTAQKEIVTFDRAGIMAPGEYRLKAPAPRSPEQRARYDLAYAAPVAAGTVRPAARMAKGPLVVNGLAAAKSKAAKTKEKRPRVPFIRTIVQPK